MSGIKIYSVVQSSWGEKKKKKLRLEKAKVEVFALKTFNLLCGTRAMI